MDYVNPTTITFTIYLIGVMIIGFIAYRYTRNFSDYILGGRSLGSFVTAMSAGASDMSGWLLMGLPGAIYVSGLYESWIAIGLLVGAYLNWLFVSGRLRVHTEFNRNALTLPDYFYGRFGESTKLIKIISAAIILFFFTIYCASGVVAGARLFESLFDMNYGTALWLGAAATIIYTFIGGFLAVSWTDTLQATLMVFALILTPIFVLIGVGGWQEANLVIATAGEAAGKEYTNIFGNGSVIAIVSAAAWGLGYFGQPHILARFMASKDVKSLRNARRMATVWMFFCLLGAVVIGYLGIAYFQTHPELAAGVNKENERIFIELVQILFNPWIAGILLSAILAAVMSTLSCQLLVCSSALTEDFYKGFLRHNAGQKELVWVGRLMVLAVACLAIWIAQDPNSKVLGLVSYAWAGFGAAFGPVVILSVFWKRTSSLGAMLGMVVGAVLVVIWKPVLGGVVYEIVPGFIACFVTIVVVSLLSQPKQSVVDRFDEADQAYKDALK